MPEEPVYGKLYKGALYTKSRPNNKVQEEVTERLRKVMEKFHSMNITFWYEKGISLD